MPRIIVMDRELHEPLTVIEIPAGLMPERRNGHRVIMLAVPPKFDIGILTHVSRYDVLKLHTTSITLEQVRRGAEEILFWFAYANEPEFALALRAAFLPGQLGEVRARETQAYFTGLIQGASF